MNLTIIFTACYILNLLVYLNAFINTINSRKFKNQALRLTHNQENKIKKRFLFWAVVPVFNLVVLAILRFIVNSQKLRDTFKHL